MLYIYICIKYIVVNGIHISEMLLIYFNGAYIFSFVIDSIFKAYNCLVQFLYSSYSMYEYIYETRNQIQVFVN